MSLGECSRCEKVHECSFVMWDYCAVCVYLLCDECMAEGCCGSTPARSGVAADAAREEDAA